jgi:hypothetical protein
MTEKRRVRARVLPTALLVVLAIGGAVVACADTTKVLGEECIKSQDCQSGLCESQVCVAAPPFLMIPTAGDSGVDASAEASAPDTSTLDSAATDGDDGGDADPG